ncbi:hypothetical protein F2Q70_00015953 [Brassica cretica]|uniref:Uncharacterized protein n=1 Tax=Brassica cretica TaxID=69181 RepID=A0A3N6Q8M0_BRACR|nr:hypothetical protein F2Q70_00015953 [Brassica cretica]
MMRFNFEGCQVIYVGEVTKGISRSIRSEEESCSYKRGILSVVEKALEMINQKSSSLSKRLSVLSSTTNFYWKHGMLQAADTFYLISVVHILGRNRLGTGLRLTPGAAPTAPDMGVRLSQIEPDFLTRLMKGQNNKDNSKG